MIFAYEFLNLFKICFEIYFKVPRNFFRGCKMRHELNIKKYEKLLIHTNLFFDKISYYLFLDIAGPKIDKNQNLLYF